MCKILGGIAIQNKSKAESLIKANRHDLDSQSDGFSVFSDKCLIRSLEYKWDKVAFDKYFLIHTRLATTGTVNKDNTHCYQLGGWTFAHNGTVGAFSSWGKWDKKKQAWIGGGDRSDSLLFFKDIYGDGIDTKTIAAAVNSLQFWGIGILFNPSEDRAILFCKSKSLYLMTDKHNSGLIFSSYEPENTSGGSVEAYGLLFDSHDKPLYSHTTQAYNQILTFELSSGDLLEIANIPATYGYTTKGKPVDYSYYD